MYKDRTCRLAIRSVRRRPSLSAITLHLLPNRQCRSRPTLCAVRYAPGGRGHAITNWQCISQPLRVIICKATQVCRVLYDTPGRTRGALILQILSAHGANITKTFSLLSAQYNTQFNNAYVSYTCNFVANIKFCV